MANQGFVCWTEIPVSDLDNGQQFYEKVFGWKMRKQDMQPNAIVDYKDDDTAVAGHLYVGKPSQEGTGATIHLVVPDNVEATAARCKDAGGNVVSPVIEIPPGRFAYALDPDGNSIGLFEPKGA